MKNYNTTKEEEHPHPLSCLNEKPAPGSKVRISPFNLETFEGFSVYSTNNIQHFDSLPTALSWIDLYNLDLEIPEKLRNLC